VPDDEPSWLAVSAVHPPKILLIRGPAELDFVDGIPDDYLRATSSYEMTPSNGLNGKRRCVRFTVTAWSGSSWPRPGRS
jgi:hypothetical protein